MTQRYDNSINKFENITTRTFVDEIAETERNISINQELAQRIANAIQSELYNKIKRQNIPGYQDMLNDMHTLVSDISKNGANPYTDHPFEQAVLIFTRLLTNKSESAIKTFLRSSIAKVLQNNDHFAANTAEFYTEEITNQLLREYQRSAITTPEKITPIVSEAITAEYNRNLTFATGPSGSTSNKPAPYSATVTALLKQQNNLLTSLYGYSEDFSNAKSNFTTLQEIRDGINYAIMFNQEAGLSDQDISLIVPPISNDQLQKLTRHSNTASLTKTIRELDSYSEKTTQKMLKQARDSIAKELADLVNKEQQFKNNFKAKFTNLTTIHSKLKTAKQAGLIESIANIKNQPLDTKQDITTHDQAQEQINQVKKYATFELETRKIYAKLAASQEFIQANAIAKPRNITAGDLSGVQNAIINKTSIALAGLTTASSITAALTTLSKFITNYQSSANTSLSAFPAAMKTNKQDLIAEFTSKANNIIADMSAGIKDAFTDLEKTNSVYASLQAIEQQLKEEKQANLTSSAKLTGISDNSFKFIKNKFKTINDSTIQTFKQNNNFTNFTGSIDTLLDEKYNLEFAYNTNYLYKLQTEEFLTGINTLASNNNLATTTFTPSSKSDFKTQLADVKQALESTIEITLLASKHQKLTGFYQVLDKVTQNSSFNLSSLDLETLNILRIENIISSDTYFTQSSDQKIIKEGKDPTKKDQYFSKNLNSGLNITNLKSQINTKISAIDSKITSIKQRNLKKGVKDLVEKNLLENLVNKFNELLSQRNIFVENIKKSLIMRGEIQRAFNDIINSNNCLGKLYAFYSKNSKPFEQKYDLEQIEPDWLAKYYPNDDASLKIIQSKTQLLSSRTIIDGYKDSWIARANQIYYNMEAINSGYQQYNPKKPLLNPKTVNEYTLGQYDTEKKDYLTYATQKCKLKEKTNLLKFIDYLITIKSNLVGSHKHDKKPLNLAEFSSDIIYHAHTNTNISSPYYFFKNPNTSNVADDFELFATAMFDKSVKIASQLFGINTITKLITYLTGTKNSLSKYIANEIGKITSKDIAARAANKNIIQSDTHIDKNIQARSDMIAKLHKLQVIKWKVFSVVEEINSYKNTKFSIANIANSLKRSFSKKTIEAQEKIWLSEFIDEEYISALEHLEDSSKLGALKTKIDNLWQSWKDQQKYMESNINDQINNDLGDIKQQIQKSNLAKFGARDVGEKELGYSSKYQTADEDKNTFIPYYKSVILDNMQKCLDSFGSYLTDLTRNNPTSAKIDVNQITTDLIRALNYKPSGSNTKSILETAGLMTQSFFVTPTQMEDGSLAQIPPGIISLSSGISATAKDFYYVAVNSLVNSKASEKYKLEARDWSLQDLKDLSAGIQLKIGKIWNEREKQIKTLNQHSNFLQDTLKFKSFKEEYKFYHKKLFEDLENLQRVNEMVSLLSELKIKLEGYHQLHKKYSDEDIPTPSYAKASNLNSKINPQPSLAKTFMNKSPISIRLAKSSFELVERISDLVPALKPTTNYCLFSDNDPNNPQPITAEEFLARLPKIAIKKQQQQAKNVKDISKRKTLEELKDIVLAEELEKNETFENLYNRTLKALEVLMLPNRTDISNAMQNKDTMVNGVNIAFNYKDEVKKISDKIYTIVSTLIKKDPINHGYGIISTTGGKNIISDFNSRRLRFETRREEEKTYIDNYSDLQKLLSKFNKCINNIINEFFIITENMSADEFAKMREKSTFKKPTPIAEILKEVNDPRVIKLIRGFAIREHSDDPDKKSINVLKKDQKLFTLPLKTKDGQRIDTKVFLYPWRNGVNQDSDYYIMNNLLLNAGDNSKSYSVTGVEYNRAEFKAMLANAVLLQKVITNQTQSKSIRLQDTELFILNTIEAVVEFIKAYKRLCDLIVANVIL